MRLDRPFEHRLEHGPIKTASILVVAAAVIAIDQHAAAGKQMNGSMRELHPDRRQAKAATNAVVRYLPERVLAVVESRALLDRHPAVQRSIALRNPYVDPLNAIQVELLSAWRDSGLPDQERQAVGRPLARSIAGIAAALRNTG